MQFFLHLTPEPGDPDSIGTPQLGERFAQLTGWEQALPSPQISCIQRNDIHIPVDLPVLECIVQNKQVRLLRLPHSHFAATETVGVNDDNSIFQMAGQDSRFIPG